MVKTQTKLLAAALTCVLLTVSCGDETTPTAPSATSTVALPAEAAQGSPVAGGVIGLLDIDINAALPSGTISLKTPAPALSSPANNATTDDLTPTLTISNSTPTNISPSEAPAFTYEFEVFRVDGATMTRVAHGNNRPAGGGTTSWTVSPSLVQTTTYTWRARAKIGNETGPWAQPYTFTTPTMITIGVPTLNAPANGGEVSTSRPDLVVNNPTVSANAGTIEIQYQIDDDVNLSSPTLIKVAMNQSSGTTTGNYAGTLIPGTTYGWRVQATNGTVSSGWSPIWTFTVVEGNRTADPTPGQALPLPDEYSVVLALAAERPDLLADSCQPEYGGPYATGTWEFLDILVERLRAKDTRWGYNCKRGNCNDVSLDVVDYHWGAGESQNSTQVYIIDVIGGHCGPDPGAAWIDQTDATSDHGDIGRWTYPR